MRKKLYLLWTSLFITASTVSLFGKVAFATSAYDGNYRTTSSLVVGDTATISGVPACSDTNVTDNWSSYITDSSKWPSGISTGELAIYGYMRASFLAALDDTTNGAWAVSQDDLEIHGGTYTKSAVIFWTEDSSAALDWTSYSGQVVPSSPASTLNRVIITCSGSGSSVVPAVTEIDYPSSVYQDLSSSSAGMVYSWGAYYSSNLFIHNFDANLPSGYGGTTIYDEASDADGDGLTAAQEMSQGTSDHSKDTDGDGLSDYTESIWNTNRDAEFCDTTTTPYVCSYPHPNAKDVYVEIDWMNNTSPSESYKPTDTQLGLVSDAFAAKGIYFHADTGQYGGGNELTTYTAPLEMYEDPLVIHDYFDYKSDNFSSARQRIWRYMISGYNFTDGTLGSQGVSGGTYAGSDNIFISYGLIKNNSSGFGWTDFNTAIAGTMLHEIGHSLCLSATQKYSHEDSECEYSGVDSGALGTDDYPDYSSVMNYADQMGMTTIDYSTGANGSPDDHDDWTSIADQMGVFTLWNYGTDSGYGFGWGATAKQKNKHTLSTGISIAEAKALKAKGLLKTGRATWRHLEGSRL